jgi:hypothetical protein
MHIDHYKYTIVAHYIHNWKECRSVDECFTDFDKQDVDYYSVLHMDNVVACCPTLKAAEAAVRLLTL